MRIDWMNTSEKHHHTKEQRDHILQAVDGLEWKSIQVSRSVPMMPGMGIKTIIREMRIPKVSHIAWSHALAPYGLYGIRGHYKLNDVDIIVIDEGSHLMVLCALLTPKLTEREDP